MYTNNKIIIAVLLFLTGGNLYADQASDQPPAKTEPHIYASAIDRRIALERQSQENPFVLTPHRPNYALLTYTDTLNQAVIQEYGHDLNNVEVKFQLSVKLQIARKIFNDNGYLYVAYTQKALWQMFNAQLSSPFRDTNHEPEVFLTFLTRQPFFGLTNRIINFGINHQSNGQTGTLSRSWNRLFAEFVFEGNHFYLSVKPWWRIPEKAKSEGDATGDDNPDITDYMGYGEVIGLYELNRHRLGFLLRNNLSGDNRGAIQLDWSLPLRKKVRGYVQYFNGYGETLLDYNHYSHRIGIGVMLIDWL